MKYFSMSVITLIFVLMVILPAGAIDVTTSVSINGGSSTAPIVIAKWEVDRTTNLENGDPTHSVAGSQFIPPCTYGGKHTLDYYAVVYDKEDGGDVYMTFADVYHPDAYGAAGRTDFKYQVNFNEMSLADSVAAWNAVKSKNLVAFGSSYTINDVEYWLVEKGLARVWHGTADLDYCQRDGHYTVLVQAIDQNDVYSAVTPNTFEYLETVCSEYDFTTINYGSINLGVDSWVPGDTTFGTAAFPTVRNLGNTQLRVKINETDMTPPFGKDSGNNWMVWYGGRLGDSSGTSINYYPYEETTLPDELDRCSQDELDFMIHVVKGPSNSYTGSATLGSTLYDS